MNPGPGPADTFDSPKQDPRLPPGQVRTDKWPVLHYGSVPSVISGGTFVRLVGSPCAGLRRNSWRFACRCAATSTASPVESFDNLWQGVAIREVPRGNRKPKASFAIIPPSRDTQPPSRRACGTMSFADRHDGDHWRPNTGGRCGEPGRYRKAPWVWIELVADNRPGF
jgi:hypothetical protein